MANDGDSFFVTLASNDRSMFTNNSMSSFKIKLATALNLDVDAWCCGLSEVIFCKSWYNITDTQDRPPNNRLFVKLAGQDNYQVVAIKQGYYSSGFVLNYHWNEAIKAFFPDAEQLPITFTYNDYDMKITMTVAEGCEVFFSKETAATLGFEHDKVYTESATGVNAIDLENGIYSIFIYSDVIKERIVASSLVPLLRVVKVPKSYGQMESAIYSEPNYFPVRNSQIDVIGIELRDDEGRLIEFTQGKVYVTLHFKRITASFFTR